VKLRVIVAGSIDWPRPDVVHEDLWGLLFDSDVTLLHVVYGAHDQGVDAAVQIWCEKARPWTTFLGKDVLPEPYPAAWNVHGPEAGILRNTRMVDSGADGYLSYLTHPEIPGFNRDVRDCIVKLKSAFIFPLVARELP
jgi:hypothetical protein